MRTLTSIRHQTLTVLASKLNHIIYCWKGKDVEGIMSSVVEEVILN